MRIAATVAMVFTEPLSAGFFVLYTFAGVTDVLDGFIARRTHTSSEKGARLDSASDLLFYAAMIIRLFPRLFKMLPKRIWIYAAAAVIIRLGSYLAAFIKYKRFASLHTYMNKLTGAAVFFCSFFYVFFRVLWVLRCRLPDRCGRVDRGAYHSSFRARDRSEYKIVFSSQ